MHLKTLLFLLAALGLSAHAADTIVTAKVGATIKMTVMVDGTPPFTFVWEKNGVVLTDKTTEVVAINPAAVSDSGRYSVTVSNSAGSTVSLNGVALSITSEPMFTLQPASVTATIGGNVTLTSVATGSPAPTYQWRKDGVNIAGATSANLVLTSVGLSSAGAYSVVATNSSGSVTSNSASLVVQPPSVVIPSNPRFNVIVVPPPGP